MIPHVLRKGLAAALGLLPLLAIGGVTPAAAATPQASASITVNDQGFNPTSVTIFLNGTVSFTNAGSIVHTATSTGGAPLPFDTGGLNPGQATSFNFSLPGNYAFNSATDCLNGNSTPNFNCGGGVVNVVASSAPTGAAAAPAPAAPAPAAPAAAPAAPAGAAQGSATVTISDKGVTPGTVNIALGGTVNFVNQGGQVHTATSTGGPVPFDSGGLGSGQSTALTFATAGTYTYNSATDCGTGASNPGGFGCGPYTIVVGNAPAAAPVSSGSTAAAQPVVSNTNVTITDQNGFTPNTLTIHTGQTVTWTNQGTNVHTASSNQGYVPTFDSGGLSTGQKFSFQFTQPGTFGYHSQTEPVYSTDPNTGNVTVAYQFNGTIVVQ